MASSSAKRREREDRKVLAEFGDTFKHDNPQVVRENGGLYVQCNACGFLVYVAELDGGGLVFEGLESGDESCRK